MLVCAFLYATCTRDRGCSAHPAFPAPSSSRGTTSCAKLGQSVSREHGFLSVSGEALLKLNPAPYTSSSRRTPGPIRRAVSFGQFVRDLLQQQTTGIMGPGVRRDDGILLSHSPKRKTRPLGLLTWGMCVSRMSSHLFVRLRPPLRPDRGLCRMPRADQFKARPVGPPRSGVGLYVTDHASM